MLTRQAGTLVPKWQPDPRQASLQAYCPPSTAPKPRITLVGTVSHPRHDDSLDVPKDAVPAVRLLGRTLRQLGSQVTRPDVRSHTPLPHGAQVLTDVIHHLFSYKRGGDSRLMSPHRAWPIPVPPPLVRSKRPGEEGGGCVDGWGEVLIPSTSCVFRI